MKFELIREIYYCGEPERVTPKEQPFPAAYQERYWAVESNNLQHVDVVSVRAVLDSNGQPVLRRTIEQKQPDADWFAEGRNHTESKPGYWTREVQKTRWCIDFETLDALMAFTRDEVCTLEGWGDPPLLVL